MKRSIIFIVLGLASCGFAFAQSPLFEFDKVKEIKLLESTRDDVIKILAKDSLEISDFLHYQHFSMMNANIRILYSSGKCFGDSEEDSEDWNVPEWKVTEITISPKNYTHIEDVRINYSKFRKEKTWGSLKNRYVYHDKASGIAIIVRNNVVESIEFSPSEKNYSSLCDKKEVKKYYSSKSWNRYPWLKKAIIDINRWADVVNLDLMVKL